MKPFRPVPCVSVLAVLAAAPAALADVSAADVWAQWKDYATRSGATVSVGSESMSGDTLTLTGVTMSGEQPEMSYSVTFDSVTMKENGDGTVSVTLPASYPLIVDIHPPGEAPAKLGLTVAQKGMTTTASGEPGALAYKFAADEMTVTLDSVESPDMEGATVKVAATMAGLAGTYDFGSGDLQPFESTFSAASLGLGVDVNAPAEDGALKLDFRAQNMSGSASGVLPETMDYADMSKALAAGWEAEAALEFGASDYDMSFREGTQTFDGKASLGGGSFTFSMDAGGMSYETAARELDMTISSSDMPFPQAGLKLGETAFGLTMPVTKSEVPQDAALLVRLVALDIDPAIWGMIDPGGQLPHDPLTLILDLAGTANWLVDIMSPEVQQGMVEVDVPGQIHTLDLNELEVTGAGASLTGTGAFTFDNNDLATWGGMPAPEGSVDLQLTGANKLIDALVTMGLIPQDQAMGAKMMMGMFAKPGEGPDTLVSKVEVTRDGHIFANGQQIQ